MPHPHAHRVLISAQKVREKVSRRAEKVNKRTALEENFVHFSALHINHRPIDAPSAQVKIDATRNKNRKRKIEWAFRRDAGGKLIGSKGGWKSCLPSD